MLGQPSGSLVFPIETTIGPAPIFPEPQKFFPGHTGRYGRPAITVSFRAMGYYESFRSGRRAGGEFIGLQRHWARTVHLSVLAAALLLPPPAVVLGPVFTMLTEGERSRLVEEEAVEALNFAITAFVALCLTDAVSAVVKPSGDAATALLVVEVIVMVLIIYSTVRARMQAGELSRRYELAIPFVREEHDQPQPPPGH